MGAGSADGASIYDLHAMPQMQACGVYDGVVFFFI